MANYEQARKLYTAEIPGSDNKWYVQGPGSGFTYDSGTLYPDQRFTNEADAKAAAVCCNEAFKQGYAAAKRDIRAALGLPLSA